MNEMDDPRSLPPSAPDMKPDEVTLNELGSAIARLETAAFRWGASPVLDKYQWELTTRDAYSHCMSLLAKLKSGVSSSPPEGEDTKRLDWLESLVIDAAGERFNIVDPLERGMLELETWGSMDLRDLIDSARAAIPPQETGHE